MAVSTVDTANAQPGRGRGAGIGRGPGANPGMRADMTTLHAMFASRDKIKRTVKLLPNGAEALTESDDQAITALLQEHVPAMENRVHANEPLPPMTSHPIFVELIKHADDYTLTYEETKKGIKVTYEATDPFVIMLVQEHAKLVSRFVKNGMEEIHKPYKLPKTDNAEPQPDGDSKATGESTSLGITPPRVILYANTDWLSWESFVSTTYVDLRRSNSTAGNQFPASRRRKSHQRNRSPTG
ncbi:hypothetical protein [Thalassoglobus neptunius]|nr:hypothetical protein [Thalassoglobus neptunius]